MWIHALDCEWHKSIGFLEICKRKRRGKRRTRKKKKGKCELKAKFTLTFCSIQSLISQANKVQWSFDSELGPSFLFQIDSGEGQHQKSCAFGSYHGWGFFYRSEVKTRDTWSMSCLKWLCMVGRTFIDKVMTFSINRESVIWIKRKMLGLYD